MSSKFNKFPPKKPEQFIFKSEPQRLWSPFQKDVFRAVAKHDGHIVVEALAGSGKSTTLIESFKYVPKGSKVIALAFNKIIQEELRARAPSYIQEIFTFHSLGYRAIKQRFGTVEIDQYKCSNLVKELVDEKDFDLINNICATVAHCKHALQDTPNQIEQIILKFGIVL